MLLRLKSILLLVACLTLVACGTTSGLIPSNATSTVALEANRYSNIVVQDFVDRTHTKKNKPQSKRRKKIMSLATQRFADKVALELEKTGSFDQVVRQPVDNYSSSANEEYLLVRGEITRYTKGNTFLRVIIGYGIGSAFLDADVTLYDANTNEQIGKFHVDRNSWLLGGIVAIAQSADFFIHRAAIKIAQEIAAVNVNEQEAVIATAPH